MGIIDDLKRLERAGDETSKTTRKLKEAVYVVAEEIAEKSPVGLIVNGYEIVRKFSNIGSAKYLEKDGIQYNQDGEGFLHGDFTCSLHGPRRAECLNFAQDIANGLIGKFAEAMETRQTEDIEAIYTLENSTK